MNNKFKKILTLLIVCTVLNYNLAEFLYANINDVYEFCAVHNESVDIFSYVTTAESGKGKISPQKYYVTTFDKITHETDNRIDFNNKDNITGPSGVGRWRLPLWRYDGRPKDGTAVNIPVIIAHGALTNRHDVDYTSSRFDIADPCFSAAQYFAMQGRDVWVFEYRGQTEESWYSLRKKIEERLEDLYRDAGTDYPAPGAYIHAKYVKDYFVSSNYLDYNKGESWYVDKIVEDDYLEFYHIRDIMKEMEFTIDDVIHEDIPAVISAVLDITGQEQVQWVGHSMGGMIIYGFLCQEAYKNGQSQAGELTEELNGEICSLPPNSIHSVVTLSSPAVLIKYNIDKSVEKGGSSIISWVHCLTAASEWLYPYMPRYLAHDICKNFLLPPPTIDLVSMQYIKMFWHYVQMLDCPNDELPLRGSAITEEWQRRGNFPYFIKEANDTNPSYLDQMEGQAVSVNGLTLQGYRIETPITAVYIKNTNSTNKNGIEWDEKDSIGSLENLAPLKRRMGEKLRLIEIENMGHDEIAHGFKTGDTVVVRSNIDINEKIVDIEENGGYLERKVIGKPPSAAESTLIIDGRECTQTYPIVLRELNNYLGIISGEISEGTVNYESNNELVLKDLSIRNEANATFKSDKKVIMKQNFIAEEGTTFTAKIK
ncbi:alpha/beta fold hydrolase [bacterium]